MNIFEVIIFKMIKFLVNYIQFFCFNYEWKIKFKKMSKISYFRFRNLWKKRILFRVIEDIYV